MSDGELLEAWSSGDQKAGSRLLGRYLLPLSRFFGSKVREDHDDLVQETFEACLHGRARLRNKNGFRPFLFGVASNVLRMHLRRRQRLLPLEALDLDLHDCSELSPEGSRLLHARDDEHVLV